MIDREEIHRVLKTFNSCVPLFIALSDEARQKLILDIAEAGKGGINVTNLSAKSHLSRPAISHHLKVLKDSSLIKPLKIGTQIFYQLNLSENFEILTALITSYNSLIIKINEADQQAKSDESPDQNKE
ncbi:MAG: ArsR family transcriptional regulator [Treponema sp.]|nr:ArsR family transcriptional regulator [Treponema sp.]